MRAVAPWRSMRELDPMRRRMENLFERFFGERVFEPEERSLWSAETWAPSVESHIENGNLKVKADLPGIDPKDVSISVLGNQLKIEGERKQEAKKEEKDYFYQELAYGKFARTLPLPQGVNADQVKAHYKDGVLEITMPAPKELTAKKIQIEAK